jgi:hypothetical protein
MPTAVHSGWFPKRNGTNSPAMWLTVTPDRCRGLCPNPATRSPPSRSARATATVAFDARRKHSRHSWNHRARRGGDCRRGRTMEMDTPKRGITAWTQLHAQGPNPQTDNPPSRHTGHTQPSRNLHPAPLASASTSGADLAHDQSGEILRDATLPPDTAGTTSRRAESTLRSGSGRWTRATPAPLRQRPVAGREPPSRILPEWPTGSPSIPRTTTS